MTSGESAGLPIQCLLSSCSHTIFVITFGIIFVTVCLVPTILTCCSIAMVTSSCWLPGMFDSLVCGVATGGIGQSF